MKIWRNRKNLLLIPFLGLLLTGGGIFYSVNKEKPTDQSVTKNPALSGPKVTLRTADGTLITARPFLVKDATTGAVIIHDINKDRSETFQFAKELAVACKCSTIILDLRGHGQSGGSKEWKDMYQDVEAAGEYLKGRGVQQITYIGFGLGAHVALKAGVDEQVPTIVLVSPDKDDKGLGSTKAILQYNGRLFIAASKTDGDANRMATKLFNLSQLGNKQFAEYETGGHGIRMVYDTDLGKVIKDWLAASN